MNPKVTRLHPRITAPVKVYDLDCKPPEEMYSKNIGLGGLFMLTRHRKAVGSPLELLIEHGTTKASVRGRVTHLRADGVGIAFVDPSHDFLEFVQTIIDDLLGLRLHGERRQDLRSPVDIRVVWSHNGVQQESRLLNLSPTGGLVECNNGPSVGSELFVFLPGYTYAFGSTRPIEARGCAARVMHITATSFGVQFVEPSAEFRMAIEDFVHATRLRQRANT
jgi:hypothetical protein